MVTHERLKQILSYDAQTGVFLWKETHCRRLRPGMVAGSRHTHCWQINVAEFGRPMLAHRLAWFYVTGSMPGDDEVIDHIDGNPRNNAFSNLRLCRQMENTWNQKISRANKTGVKGVSVLKDGRFHARVAVAGKVHLLGNHDTLEAAAAAVQAKREMLHGEYANHG